MSAPLTETVADTDRSAETTTLDSLESVMKDAPKSQAWRRLEEIEDDRRLRHELADLDDLDIDGLEDFNREN